MSRTIFLIFFVVGAALAEVPSYIHVCGRKNPDLEKCIIESLTTFRDKLKVGIPEYDVPSAEPMKLGHIQLLDSPSLKATADNVDIHGITNFKANSVSVDFDKMVVQFEVFFEKLMFEANYDIVVRILIPVNGRGFIRIDGRDMTAKVTLNYILAERKGKQYMYFPSVATKLKITDFASTLDNANSTVMTAVSQALGGSHEEILQTFTPALERVVSEKILLYGNAIVRHFPFDELFPDRA